MGKKVLSLALIICMLLTMMPAMALTSSAEEALTQTGDSLNPYKDLKESDWFYKDALYVMEKGLFKGISDTLFSPNGTMTRAMYVTVLGRMAGIEVDDYSGTSFNDVMSDSWYAPYVKWANEMGISNGTGVGKFNPNGLINREQMAVFTVRFFDAYNIAYPDTVAADMPADYDNISDYAKAAVMKLWSCGLFKGDDQGNFNPAKTATRAEAASFCSRTEPVAAVHFENAKKDKEDKPQETEKPQSTNPPVYPGTPTSSTYTVSFMDGDTLIERMYISGGYTVTILPDNTKTAKEGRFFAGWFTDSSLTTPYYPGEPVLSNQIVYAKYEDIVKEELTPSSFAQMDQSPDLSFTVQKTDPNAVSAVEGILLEVMDGTEPVALSITPSSEGLYIVSAQGGFNEGSSYKLTLADGYVFYNKAESIRSASFSIKKEEVKNFTLNSNMVYIKDTADIYYIVGDTAPVEVLESALLSSSTEEEITGSFNYPEADTLSVGTVLCIYENVDPKNRDYINEDYSDDAEAYVEVTAINGDQVSFKSLDEADAEKVVFIPDTIPFSVDQLPTGDTGTVSSTLVDTAAREEMGLTEVAEIEIGDFLVFYMGAFADLTEGSDVYYGKVTDVTDTMVSYAKSSREEIESSLDTYLQQEVKGDYLLEGVDSELLEDQIVQQVIDSGFAENAAEYLAMTATQTDGFKSLKRLSGYTLTDVNGKTVTPAQLQLLAVGKEITLSDDVKVKAVVSKSSKYFNDGIRLALSINAEFTIDAGEEGEIKFDLSATFVEEVSVDITASAKAKVKWILLYPDIKSLTFSTNVDVKNYAGISVDVRIYTVEKEEESVWDKLKGLKDGEYKETFEQIEELKDKITQARETADTIAGYIEDLENLWASIPSDLTNKEEYEGMLETLGELNVTQELMDLLNLTSETELDAGVKDLMERYSELMSNESDWIEILNKKIFQKDIHISIFSIGIGANFVIKGNVNLALGANLEYVVGKRYSFWFDIIKKTSGSSEMDLLDEKFAFQFYVMGELGLKMGVEAEICAGVISTKIGSIGFTAEFGPYIKLWGYFIYEYTKQRPANTSSWISNESMMGAMYLEFGLYLELTFKAQALGGQFKYQPTLLDKEWPLLTAGTRNSVYDFAYELTDDDVLQIKDSDNNSSNGVTMQLPDTYLQMKYIDLCEGVMAQDIYPCEKYNFTLSNRNFSIDKDTGLITVTVPEDVQYMECDLTLTWKSDKLAFSRYDLSVTIPLVWTNLSTDELKERYTVSVKAGNANDGYTTVWSKRVVKNAPFDLPEDSEIRAILNVDSYESGAFGNLKYASISGYGSQSTEDLIVLRDAVYYYEVEPRTYTITVKDTQNKDGTTSDLDFTARYGDKFNLTGLQSTGTEDVENEIYTSFLSISSKDSTGKDTIRDFGAPIDKAFAAEILSGASYTAEYTDNSTTVTFQFEGENIDLPPIEVKVKKGSIPSSEYYDEAVAGKNAFVTSISPAFAPITGPITYTITCEIQEKPIENRTLSFNTNGGEPISQRIHPAGSLITLPTSQKTGYNFAGWYIDSSLTQEFEYVKMPDEDTVVYAKWTAKEYTVSFDVNEGNPLEEGKGSKSVVYNEPYGLLPVPVRDSFSFAGWYTARSNGYRIDADTVVNLTENHTLYAHWSDKAHIDYNDIDIPANQVHVYDGNEHPLVFTTGESGLSPDSFTVAYKRQNLDDSWSAAAIYAGTYDVKITRAEIGNYQSFEKTFMSKLTINKAERAIDAEEARLEGSSYKANLLINEILKDSYPGDGAVEYAVSTTQTVPTSGWQTSRVFMNLDRGNYYLFARVSEGENYLTTDAIVSVNAESVDGITVNAMGYTFGVTVKTSDIKYAGTDSIIKGQLGFVDGTKSELTHFDNSGNDFERNDTGSYEVLGVNRDPWMINQVTIDYSRKGSNPGWHCEYVQPYAEKVKVISTFPFLIYNLVEGDRMSVNQWFGSDDHDYSHVVWTGSTDSMKRIITSVGNFNSLADSLLLSSSDNDTYTFTYDGMVTDQYTLPNTSGYDAYEHNDAPLLSISTSDAEYKNCINYTINGISVNKAALYSAMKAKGATTVTLEVKLQFPERSTTSDTATHTRTITVTLGD